MLKKINRWLSLTLVNHKTFSGYFKPIIHLLISNWKSSSYRAKVVSIRDENKQVYTLVLKVSRFWKEFRAGQYIEISLDKNGSQLMRIFSISSSPYLLKSKGIIELTIAKQDNGKVTPWIHKNIKPGDTISVSAAKGDFTLKESNQALLFVAAGSGITPFRSMLNELLKQNSKRTVSLLYYAKSNNHLFINELNKLCQNHSNFKIKYINTDKLGRISLKHLQSYCPDFTDRKSYICGPNNMIDKSVELLQSQGVNTNDIIYERFGAKKLESLELDTKASVIFAQSNIMIESKDQQVETLLNMAESKGLKPITGCRMGICHQCICQKSSGIIYNTLNKTFSDTGSEEVQLCVSVPVGEVTINL